METITLGGGCFWCLEAVFQKTKGVESVISGYAGGHTQNPSYEEICQATTGHAEVVQIKINPNDISFEQILEIFWNIHDPTTKDRQGNDIGPQYRSIILYHNETQKAKAEKSVLQLEQSGKYSRPIVTEIKPLEVFYPAEQYHQNYFENNPQQGYCQFVIRPKLLKAKEKMSSWIK